MIDDNEDELKNSSEEESQSDKTIPDKETDKGDADQERLEILMKADQVKGQQLTIDAAGEFYTEDELKKLVLSSVQDPEKMYETYYKGISKLLKQNLPTGSDFKPARDLIYEEKNCFLTRGHRIGDDGIRGADSRMGYVEDAEIVLGVVISWVVNKGTAFDLFTTLRDLNNGRGYSAPK
ncbi:hypothetical protein [Larkinella terrae]|uniref:Uncharacterized protein n=1 Tax=Larkinella terrae TaxID=2025311 RepID=A0A7K0EH04_9BACT|nr:hypothetical protein [Larkinella terrae]MRS61130.1 hypothetical protein [Larkinella terrae]